MKRVLVALAAVFFLVFNAVAQMTNALSDAEIKGEQLALEILEQQPTQNYTGKGMLQIQNGGQQRIEIPIEFDTFIGSTNSAILQLTNEVPAQLEQAITQANWEMIYQTKISPTNDYQLTEKYGSYLLILHGDEQSNLYLTLIGKTELLGDAVPMFSKLTETQTMFPFANSDFWICDLGLEFFHWPQQKILKHETRRTRDCTVLESTNPNPAPGSYSRVVSWVDNETLGVVHAEAYDANGKLLKEFDPKSFKKVNGQWELQDMEIQNVQTKSRTWIKFDLSGKS